MEQVILVDKNDNQLGLMGKRVAHKGQGVLHRAVSVLLYRKKNGKTEVLLQQRAKEKPLWPLFWSNTVCTHPLDGELPLDCAVRRLKEEMGITVGSKILTFIAKISYQAAYNSELGEHELDHIFIGSWDGTIECNKKEVADYRWRNWEELKVDMQKKSSLYTPWFTMLVLGGNVHLDS